MGNIFFCFSETVFSFPLGTEETPQIGGNPMTDLQKERITALRNNGSGYTGIAKAVGLSKDSVKAYCRVHNLSGVMAKNNARVEANQEFCLNCGKPLQQKPGRKMAKFCSDKCRQQWWNSHPEQVNKKAVYSFTCALCKKPFTAYGNSNRKYCCHACYIESRFKDGEQHE